MLTQPIRAADDEKIVHLLRREKYKFEDDRKTRPGGLLWIYSVDRLKEEHFFRRQKERGYDFRFAFAAKRLNGKAGWWWEQNISPWGLRRPQKELRLLAGPIVQALGQEVLKNPRIAKVVVEEVVVQLQRNSVTLEIAQGMVEKLRRELRLPSVRTPRTTKDLIKDGF
jgi:hypothetical protein